MPDNCDVISGTAATVCEKGGAGQPTVPESLDPLTNVAHSTGKAAGWIVERFANILDGGAGTVDFTNRGFLAQYAIVFAASTVLTLVIWLIAVAKRAVNGVPITRAMGEAVGNLWMAVGATAFTPAILYLVVSAVDEVTEKLGGGSASELFRKLAETLSQTGDQFGGGPIIQIAASLVTIILCGILGLELVARASALYVGTLLGILVYSGMVDRALWSKVRKWMAVMIALILVKPVIVMVVGISNVFTAEKGDDATPVVVAGITVMILAVLASAKIFSFIPGYGDEISAGLAKRAVTSGGKLGMAGIKGAAGTAAGVVASGIQTHGGREPRGSNGGRKNNSSSVSEGIQAHGTRESKGKKSK